jgi:hypothetical protein
MKKFTLALDERVFIQIEFDEQENAKKTRMTWSGKGYKRESETGPVNPQAFFSFSFSVGRDMNQVEDFSIHTPYPKAEEAIFSLQEVIVQGIMGYYRR